MRNGERFDTIEEARQAAMAYFAKTQYGDGTNIFRDPDDGRYYQDSAGAVTVFDTRSGASPTYQPIERVFRDGHSEPPQRNALPGDIEFHGGSVYQVRALGDPTYQTITRDTIRRGLTMPQFRKLAKERGLVVIKWDAKHRNAIARTATAVD